MLIFAFIKILGLSIVLYNLTVVIDEGNHEVPTCNQASVFTREIFLNSLNLWILFLYGP